MFSPKSGDEASAALAIMSTVKSLKQEDYAFTVTVHQLGLPAQWDVYRFFLNGSAGMIAVRIRDGDVEVGMFEAGSLSEDEVCAALVKSAPN